MADFDITLRLALLAKTVLAGSWLAPDAIAEDADDARDEIERLRAQNEALLDECGRLNKMLDEQEAK